MKNLFSLLSDLLRWVSRRKAKDAANIRTDKWLLVHYDFGIDWYVEGPALENCKLIRPRPESLDRPSQLRS